MGKIKDSDVFAILVKDNKENILEKFGTCSLSNIKNHFVDDVADTVDINNESVKRLLLERLYILHL